MFFDPKPGRDFDRASRWFGWWFAFCALVGVASLCGMGWLLLAVVDWLGRH